MSMLTTFLLVSFVPLLLTCIAGGILAMNSRPLSRDRYRIAAVAEVVLVVPVMVAAACGSMPMWDACQVAAFAGLRGVGTFAFPHRSGDRARRPATHRRTRRPAVFPGIPWWHPEATP